ncbi:oxidoreductase [Corynebacterium bovis]|nr:NADPH-dependent 2,4-dienoyl-CoA reductase [Corynebacterium bovis]
MWGYGAASAPYPHMFRPLDINGMRLPNRTVMGSIHTGLEDRLWDADALGAFMAERARGGVGLIVTGGIAPSRTGQLLPFAAKMTNGVDVRHHRRVTSAVHAAGGRVCMQILHAGRYGATPLKVAPGSEPSPIHPFRHLRMTDGMIRHVIRSYGRAAALAREAGYDAVEIMGGEGYLVNQFLCPRTNDRTDGWGGSTRNRQRFLVEVIDEIRRCVPADFPVLLRQSVADLVEGGQTWDEVALMARRAEAHGVDAINTDIGWHEATVPTIVTSVPRAAFVRFTERLRDEVDIPLIASNRINTPEVAEEILARGLVDAVSMARPLLADPAFVDKAREGRADEINTCIACNQACLDHAFVGKKVSCLVNPRAGRETTLTLTPARRPRTVVVVGAGPAGLAAAVTAAECGHRVHLVEAGEDIGGQFSLAARIPGKEEFAETLRYFRRRLDVLGVTVTLGRRLTGDDVARWGGAADAAGTGTAGAAGTEAGAGAGTAGTGATGTATPTDRDDALPATVDHVIVATGVTPRVPSIPGVDHPRVMTYADCVAGVREPGRSVAVLGAGGIGFDVAEFLTTDRSPTLDLAEWEREWGVTDDPAAPGAVTRPAVSPSPRDVVMIQRSPGRQGRTLNKTTGWVHKAAVRKKGVEQIVGATYDRIDDAGLHLSFRDDDGTVRDRRVLDVESIVLCTGQEPVRDLVTPLTEAGVPVTVIGGADVAAELDAKRAILQGTQAALAVR